MKERVWSGLVGEVTEVRAFGGHPAVLQSNFAQSPELPLGNSAASNAGLSASSASNQFSPSTDSGPAQPGGGSKPDSDDEDGTPLWDRAVKAFQWQFATVFGRQGLQFVVVAVLARLLVPEDFGLVVQASIFVGFANLFQDMGAAMALVQRTTITDAHIRVAFTFAMVTGLAMTVLAWFLAWIPALLFETPALEPLLQFLSLTLLLKSASVTAICLLTRRMDFRTTFWLNTISYVIGSAIVGVGLALAGYGPWALAWAYLIQDLVLCAMALLVVRHPMRPLFARAEAKQLLGFGIGLTLSKVIFYATQNLDMFVVGRWLGAAPLGLYSRACQLTNVSNLAFAQVLGNVLFPALSKMQNDTKRLRNAYLRAVSSVSLVAFPIFTGLAVVAPEAIRFVFGPQWDESVQPLQVLCAGGVFWSVTTLSDQLAQATGAVYPLFRRRIVWAVAIFGGALIGSQIGIAGVAMGVAAALLLMYLLMAHLSLKLIEGTWREFVISQVPGACVATLITVCAHVTAALLRAQGLSTFSILAPSVAVGVGVGVISVFTIPRSWLPDSSRWILEKIDAVVARAVLHLEGRGFPVPFMAGKFEK